jgi:phenylacetic acid degradation operon negative regulatory protein
MDRSALTIAQNELTSLGPQRVWSLLVTVFGDLAQSENDTIDGPVLSILMTDMAIKPEAVRVALHRLRNDNWITSAKHGRTSRHSLTEHGRQISAAANPRIYGPSQDTAKNWQLVMLESTSSQSRTAMEKLGFAPLMPRVYVGASDAKPPKNALALPAVKTPAWLSAQFEPKDLVQDYAALHSALTKLEHALAKDHDLNAREIAVLRSAIVHSWRRLVLRHPNLPRQLYSDDWRGHDCRVLVMELLNRLPRPALSEIALS